MVDLLRLLMRKKLPGTAKAPPQSQLRLILALVFFSPAAPNAPTCGSFLSAQFYMKVDYNRQRQTLKQEMELRTFVFFISCSLTMEEVGHPSFPLK